MPASLTFTRMLRGIRTRKYATEVVDRVPEVVKALNKLTETVVMVGIPATTAFRDDTNVTNAAIGYVLETGAPERNLPARPFLVPGVRNAQDGIIRGFKQAAVFAADGKSEDANNQLIAIGMFAVNSVKQKMYDGPFAPLAPMTIARRMAKLKGTKPLTKSHRAAGFVDIRPLIDTGRLRDSITWVLRPRPQAKKLVLDREVWRAR